MSLEKNLIDNLVKVTSRAAVSCFKYVGKGDKKLADKAATDSMRYDLNNLDINGEVVIGEGELDNAPMLYIGEKIGKGNGPFLDIAVDPLEGTNFVAKNLPNSFSVLAATKKGNLLSAPDTYMEKIAIGSNLPPNLLDLDNSVETNIKILAEAKDIKPDQLNACVLDRPRHKKIVESLKKMKVNINFITDGDVSGAISVIDENSKNDIYLGIGGGPEGVLAAAALSCLGGQIQTRLVVNQEQKKRAIKLGIKDIAKKYNIDEMVKGDVIFCATGITDGDLVKGIVNNLDSFSATTFILHKESKTNKKVTNVHKK